MKSISILFAMVGFVMLCLLIVVRLTRKAEADPVMEHEPVTLDPVTAARRHKLLQQYWALTDMAIKDRELSPEDSDRLATVYNDLKRLGCRNWSRPS